MNKLYSKFAIPPIVVALIITLMAPFLIYMSANSPAAGLLIPILYLLFAIYYWLTEFRTRAHRVIVEPDRISVKEYFGFGNTKAFRYDEFEGFIISQQPGRFGSKDYIFLIRNGKRQICISEFYHSNYSELKEAIETKCSFLGQKEYSWGYEYKQMFR